MLTLSGRVISKAKTAIGASGPRLYSLTTDPDLPSVLLVKKALLMKTAAAATPGFQHYFVFDGLFKDRAECQMTLRS